MAKIYDKNGWVNWDYIINQDAVFYSVTGARGVGKTYGLFKWCIEHDKKFIYLRRLKSQLDQCSRADGNPFKKINADMDLHIMPKRSGGNILFMDGEKLVAVGVALSTVANVRGIDFSDYDLIVFDEAIASEGERPIPKEFNAFQNFYETVNRNRELAGDKPVIAVLLGNANKLTNAYFSGWKFTKTALKMLKGGQMVWRSADGTRIMILLLDSPISKKKAETGLYKNASKDFMSMALDNAFRTDATNIKSMPLIEFIHIVSVGEIGIYKHKTERKYYVSFTTKDSPYYDSYGIGLKMFQQDFYNLRLYYMINKTVFFENYECELIFRELYNLT